MSMKNKVLTKSLVRKSSLPVRWATPVFEQDGKTFIQSSRNEVVVDAFYPLELASLSSDFEIVDRSTFDKLIRPEIPRPEEGSLLWHSISVGDEFLIGDIKSLGTQLGQDLKDGSLPSGMDYVKEEISDLVEIASEVRFSPSQKKQQFLLSSRKGQLVPEMNDSFEERLRSNASATEAMLGELLSSGTKEDEVTRPENLQDAMRHGVLNGGKRLRPFLTVEITRLLGGDISAALRIGAALELLHCHSLIHDDLPAMDNDDVRRGQPTVHKKFDEATAILAGDALLVLAFDVIADPETTISDRQKVELTLALSRAAGHGGMMGGQALDLAAELKAPDEAGIVTLQAMKTGALIRYACEAGAILAGASNDERKRFRSFGEKIGLAFQVADDLLDLTSDPAVVGKATNKDAARGRGTLVALYGIGWAEETLQRLTSAAFELLSPYGREADVLRNTASFIAYRKN